MEFLARTEVDEVQYPMSPSPIYEGLLPRQLSERPSIH
jgi:hypothetical protein